MSIIGDKAPHECLIFAGRGFENPAMLFGQGARTTAVSK